MKVVDLKQYPDDWEVVFEGPRCEGESVFYPLELAGHPITVGQCYLGSYDWSPEPGHENAVVVRHGAESGLVVGGVTMTDHRIICGDARTVLPTLEAGSVDLICTDPPYGMRKGFAGDGHAEEALALLAEVLPEFLRVLKPNGSCYIFAGPQVAARAEVLVGEYLHVLNRVRWVKEAGWHQKTEKEGLRSYLSPWEEVIFAEHPAACVEYENTSEGLRGGVFESIRQYLDGERRRAGVDYEQVREAVDCAPGSGLPGHWFTRSQWQLPTAEHYASLQRLFNERGNGSGQYLRREHEDLRREHEDLRRPFAVTADVPYTDVWTFPTVAGRPGKHPCEKPVAMLEHIISASSRPGALVLDPFCGSGSAGVACFNLGRKFLGVEVSEHWANVAERGLAQTQAPLLTT